MKKENPEKVKRGWEEKGQVVMDKKRGHYEWLAGK